MNNPDGSVCEHVLSEIERNICDKCTDKECIHGVSRCNVAVAQAAIDRLIPQRPAKMYCTSLCPSCEEPAIQNTDDPQIMCFVNFCPNCGQAIDWSD